MFTSLPSFHFDFRLFEKWNKMSKYRQCRHQDCEKEASFGLNGTKERLFCSKHKEQEMIDLAGKICAHEVCPVSASYNFEGMPRKYCGKHIIFCFLCSRQNMSFYFLGDQRTDVFHNLDMHIFWLKHLSFQSFYVHCRISLLFHFGR